MWDNSNAAIITPFGPRHKSFDIALLPLYNKQKLFAKKEQQTSTNIAYNVIAKHTPYAYIYSLYGRLNCSTFSIVVAIVQFAIFAIRLKYETLLSRYTRG